MVVVVVAEDHADAADHMGLPWVVVEGTVVVATADLLRTWEAAVEGESPLVALR